MDAEDNSTVADTVTSSEPSLQEAVPVLSKSGLSVPSDPKVVELRALIPPELSALLSDGDCSRFLRARSQNAAKAADMIVKWGKWWHTPLPGLDVLPKDISSKPDEQEDVYRRMLPHANLGEDMNGRPIYWEKTGQSEYVDIIQNICVIINFCWARLSSFRSFVQVSGDQEGVD